MNDLLVQERVDAAAMVLVPSLDGHLDIVLDDLSDLYDHDSFFTMPEIWLG